MQIGEENMWRKIAEMIDLPKEVIESLLAANINIKDEKISKNIFLLTRPDESLKAKNALKELLPQDDKGFKILLCMLDAAGIAYEEYKIAGISENVFVATMKCFTRFVNEHMASYGEYGFDRDFWTWRQLSLMLFRIGELEYEKCNAENGEKFISLHIPSDAVISNENCLKSRKLSKEFFKKYYPDYENVQVRCTSWLLSPDLKNLLPENSRILQFQQLFDEKIPANEGADNFLEWVYKRKDIPIAQLPENTTLQRNMKKYLLDGNWISEGEGIFID